MVTKLKPTIYFLGIGGIGISALAKLALGQGLRVLGEDLANSNIIRDLKRTGAAIKIKNKDNHHKLNAVNLIIYSTAVPINHPLLTKARQLKIPAKSYPQVLGEISQSCFTIAVSGMHGKSTVTAMIGLMLESANFDPLVIVGTKVPQWKGNIRIPHRNWNLKSGTKPIFVVEADEYRSAMLNLAPDIIVLTRIEEDHLDYYKNLEHIKREFRKYLERLPKDGTIIVNWRDENIKSTVKLLNCQIVKYNYRDERIKKKIRKILKVPGRHNLENALAAYQIGKRLGLTKKQILTGISKFKGTWRRLEEAGRLQIPNSKFQIPVISDYAHHPTEIKATLQAIREKYPNQRLVLAYQPHQHNRTKKLFAKFVGAFDQADVLILNEIFDVAGREESCDQNISSRDLVREIKKRIAPNCYYTKTLADTKKKILELVKPNDIIIIMGAGDIDKVARELVNRIKTQC